MPKSKEYVESSESDSEVSSSDSEPKKKKQKKVEKKAKSPPPKKRAEAKKEKPAATAASSGGFKGDDGTTMYPLSKQRNISVSEFRGNPYINIREYYEKDGKTLPGKKGISLSKDQWEKLKSYIADIDSDLSRF